MPGSDGGSLCICLARQLLSAPLTASTHCLQSQDKPTTYKLLLGLFYSKRPCYFLELVFLCKNNKTQLLLQAPGKITEPQYTICQLPCPARRLQGV